MSTKFWYFTFCVTKIVQRNLQEKGKRIRRKRNVMVRGFEGFVGGIYGFLKDKGSHLLRRR